MELFQNLSGKSYFIAPYDFDESHMDGLTANVFKDRFASFRKQLPADLVGIVLPSIKEHSLEFIKRLKALPPSYPLTPKLKETLAAYSVALKEFADGL
ncbi:MAG: hypothetical protein EOP04_27180 [Proteobacteria bacterium]|nr:MAG: hypothetical protein EOP04_27180 [Pseudomonadota bacterium]